MVLQCAVPGCKSRGSGIKFFCVPFPVTNKHRWEAWLVVCPFLERYSLAQLENVRICIFHFESSSINRVNDKLKLNRDAIPKLNLPAPSTSDIQRHSNKDVLNDVDSNSLSVNPVQSGKDLETSETRTLPYKSETMWDVKACRGCLTVKGKLEKVGCFFKRVYSSLTELTFTNGDGYPNYFCLECRAQMKKCMAFRRKTRRAHFVLKEIMTVRKQVTYSDIVTVNRKKTNLESSLNFWDPRKSGYLAINTEGEVDESSKKDFKHNRTRILDIKPEVKEEVEKETISYTEEDLPESVSDLPNTGETVADADCNDIPEEPVPEDLDLNDIFKDLNDDKSDTETVVSEVQTTAKPKTENDKEPVDVLEGMVKSNSLRAVMDALEMCSIKVLDLEEQKDRMEIRKANSTFALALYKCSMCLTTYENMPKLIEHVAFHNTRRDGHECQICKNKYLTVEDLNKHIAQWHMYEYTCKECKHQSYCLFDAVKHSKTSHGVYERYVLERNKKINAAMKMFTLSPLPRSVMEKIKALREIQCEDNDETENKEKFKCGICEQGFTSLPYLDGHMSLRHNFLYTCIECKEIFTDRKNAIQHAAVHDNSLSYQCELCHSVFKTKRKLRLHRCKAQQPIPCNLCGISIRSPSGHYKHQLVKHSYLSLNDPLVGDPQYKCADCGVQFVDKKGYEKHVVTSNHAGADDVEFACVPCKKMFDDEEQMETHFITCGRNKKYPRKCCYCEEVLADHVQYKKHYFNQHPTLQYRYVKMNSICELCGKMILKYQLEAHLKTHEVAAYECRHCGVASPTATAHVSHVLTAHAAKPFCCSLCARRFQHRADCKDHILKVHAPTKLYKCQFCDQEFSYFKHLKDHSESQHNLIIPSMKAAPKKSKTTIFVYAHMNIEINELEREAVENSEVAMLDYLDQKSKPVDYRDFFIFKANPDEYIVRIHKLLRKKKKAPRAKIKIESDIVFKPTELEEAVNQIECETKRPIMEELKMMDDFETPVEEIQNEEVAEPMEVEENLDGVEAAAESGGPLEVFENDGTHYVMIGGELYRIAGDEEEEE